MRRTSHTNNERTSASSTARLIAAATVMAAESGDPATAPPIDAGRRVASFLRVRRADWWLLAGVRSLIGGTMCRWIESLAAPGIMRHWMHRKRVIDRLVRTAASDGYSQLIVLGAGLDSLGLRMAGERKFASILMADRPATLDLIRQTLSFDASDSPLHLLPLDLGEADWESKLAGAVDRESTGGAVVVIEGVLMYLEPACVERVVASIAALPVPRVRLIASWMFDRQGEPIGFTRQSSLVPSWLCRKGETMRSAFSPDGIAAMLRKAGWSEVAVEDLAATNPHRRSGDVAGEWLLYADRKSGTTIAHDSMPARNAALFPLPECQEREHAIKTDSGPRANSPFAR